MIDGAQDVVLYPGDFVFAEAPTRLRTLLGSCVAITWWHPGTRLGAMCHFLVPSRTRVGDDAERQPDGRYADEAVQLFLWHASRAGTSPQEWTVKVFGGGRQFAFAQAVPGEPSLSDRNVAAALDLLAQHSMAVAARHIGGRGHRQVVFDLSTGTVFLRHEGGNDPGRPHIVHTGSASAADPRQEVPA